MYYFKILTTSMEELRKEKMAQLHHDLDVRATLTRNVLLFPFLEGIKVRLIPHVSVRDTRRRHQ